MTASLSLLACNNKLRAYIQSKSFKAFGLIVFNTFTVSSLLLCVIPYSLATSLPIIQAKFMPSKSFMAKLLWFYLCSNLNLMTLKNGIKILGAVGSEFYKSSTN